MTTTYEATVHVYRREVRPGSHAAYKTTSVAQWWLDAETPEVLGETIRTRLAALPPAAENAPPLSTDGAGATSLAQPPPG